MTEFDPRRLDDCVPDPVILKPKISGELSYEWGTVQLVYGIAEAFGLTPHRPILSSKFPDMDFVGRYENQDIDPQVHIVLAEAGDARDIAWSLDKGHRPELGYAGIQISEDDTIYNVLRLGPRRTSNPSVQSDYFAKVLGEAWTPDRATALKDGDSYAAEFGELLRNLVLSTTTLALNTHAETYGYRPQRAPEWAMDTAEKISDQVYKAFY